MEKIGIIAGNKRFPILFCEAAKRKNYYVVAVAIKNDTSRNLKNFVDKIYWIDLNEFPRMFDIFKNEGVKQIVMAGQINPYRLFTKEAEQSQEIKNLLRGIKDKRADTIFGAIAERIKESGLQLMDSTILIEDLLPKKGPLTKKEPNFDEWEDIYFGFDLAKSIAFLDIGQAVAVKKKAIVAVEAIEGTDNLIKRSGKIAGSGIVVVKVSKPNQDMRFDIPVVGLNTVKNLVKTRAVCLAIEAGKTLFIDKEQSIRLADRKGIAIVAV